MSLRHIAALPLALLVMALAATSTAALTISPTGSFTDTSTTDIYIYNLSTRSDVHCGSSRISYTIGADGTGTSPAGTSTWTTCNSNLIAGFTATQTRDWTIAIGLSSGLITKVVTIPTGGIRFQAGTCSMTYSGTITYGHAYAGSLPVTILMTDVFSVLSSSLIVDSVSGCTPLLVIRGLAATVRAPYTLSRAFTVSG